MPRIISLQYGGKFGFRFDARSCREVENILSINIELQASVIEVTEASMTASQNILANNITNKNKPRVRHCLGG